MHPPQVLKQLAPYKNLVVATGGGSVIKPLNWSYLHGGVTAWLTGPTQLLAVRVAKDGIARRPLLAGDVPPADLEDEDKLYETAKAKLDTLLQVRQLLLTCKLSCVVGRLDHRVLK